MSTSASPPPGTSHPTRLDAVVVEASRRRSSGSWKLKYHDISPRSSFSSSSSSSSSSSRAISNGGTENPSFVSLMERANEWLKKNPDIVVKTCESITWMDTDPKKLGDCDQVILTKKCSVQANTYYLRGLRIWYTPRTGYGKVSANAQLGFTDHAPVDSADTIASLVNRANRKVDQGAFKGQVLSVETVSVPIINGNIDTHITQWSEGGADDSPQAFVLRVFFYKDDAYKEQIGIKDFVPQPSDEGYEGFESLIEKANTWFRDQADLRVTNCQSVMVQKDEGPHSETGSACFYTMPGLNSEHPVEFFRILRLAYTRPTGDIGNGSLSELPIIYPFTYENFTPEFITTKDSRGRERIERMKEMFSRVGNFLRTSGADLICAETVMNPMQLVADDLAQSPDEIKWLFTLRLYTTNQVVANNQVNQLQSEGSSGRNSFSKRSSMRQKSRKEKLLEEEEEEKAHPGPIFLGNVVTQQYRYRWMVAAISVFVMMTIIVVVSVVYSNQ